jgi:hypothetical protein
MRLLTDGIHISLGVAAAFWLSALPAAAHPTIDVGNPQPGDRIIAGSLVMEGVAYDHDARLGAGIDRVSVRICGPGGPYLGDAVLGLPSTISVDKGDAQYANAGWKLTAALRGAGDMRDLCVTARSSVNGTETLVRIPITIGTAPPPPGRPADTATDIAHDPASGAGAGGTPTGDTGASDIGAAAGGTGGAVDGSAGTGNRGSGGAGSGATGTGGAGPSASGVNPDGGGPEE